MEIKYKLTPELVANAKIETLATANRALDRVIALCDQSVILLLLIASAILFGGIRKSLYWASAYLLLNLIYYIFIKPKRMIGYKAFTKESDQIKMTAPVSNEERVLIINNGVILIESGGVHVKLPSKRIYSVTKLKECMHIRGGLGEGLTISTLIPYSALGSMDEVEKMCGLLNNKG